MRSSSRFFVFVVMFRAIVSISATFEVSVSFFYTIEIVGVVVEARRGQFWTGNRPFLGPESDSGAVPDPPGDPGERPDAPTSKISDTC